MNDSKKWYESKTLWLAIAQGVAGVFVVLATQYPAVGWIAIGKSVVDFFIRYNTSSPIA